jgi:hypothetical protein
MNLKRCPKDDPLEFFNRAAVAGGGFMISSVSETPLENE